MSPLWSYFWPALGAGLIVGILTGAIAFRRRSIRNLTLSGGIAVSIALAALWHGPLGAADRFSGQVERTARETLVYYEMTQISAVLHHGPLTRRIQLAGTADEFQRSELARIMGELPGVSDARWSPSNGGLPLIAEACIVALGGFLLGLLLAYLVDLRRRYNAQWKW